MKVKNIISFIFIILGLSACGSGGGGGDSTAVKSASSPAPTLETPTASHSNSTPATTPATQPETMPIELPKPANTETPRPSPPFNPSLEQRNHYASSMGMAFIIPKTQEEVRKASVSLGEGVILSVEGKELAIYPPGVLTDLVAFHSENMIRLGGTGHNIRWMFMSDQDTKNMYLLALGANLSEKIPQQGKAIYAGYAAHVQLSKEIVSQKAVLFDVDFANKMLNGAVLDEDRSILVPLFANINHNVFTGEQNGVEVHGGFYGSEAEEIVGDYIKFEETGAIDQLGTFGAKKQ